MYNIPYVSRLSFCWQSIDSQNTSQRRCFQSSKADHSMRFASSFWETAGASWFWHQRRNLCYTGKEGECVFNYLFQLYWTIRFVSLLLFARAIEWNNRNPLTRTVDYAHRNLGLLPKSRTTKPQENVINFMPIRIMQLTDMLPVKSHLVFSFIYFHCRLFIYLFICPLFNRWGIIPSLSAFVMWYSGGR